MNPVAHAAGMSWLIHASAGGAFWARAPALIIEWGGRSQSEGGGDNLGGNALQTCASETGGVATVASIMALSCKGQHKDLSWEPLKR
jgi:hypothetical protein